MEPFLKWAGGKRQLIERIEERAPIEYDIYYEPFVGGGAILFHLQPARAVINDKNEQLINVYRQLQKDPAKIVKALKKFDSKICTQEYYIAMRAEYNEKIAQKELDSECAAYMIWINKHCFNGLYRVNAKGFFNVPWNKKTSGSSMNEDNLLAIGNYLQNADVKITCKDFTEICNSITEKDFVYFDSPYVPMSDTASFTDYTKEGFTYEDHVRLANVYRRLSEKGVRAMLSNHDVGLVYELYCGFKIEQMEVKRFINSNAQKRSGKEVLITNYEL